MHVEILFPKPATTFVMPRAIPMGYGEQRYDRFVSNLDGEREEGPRWKLKQARSIQYDVDVRRMEREILSAADTSKLREKYAGFLGYSIFGFAEGMEELPARLQIHAPEGWAFVSTLSPIGAEMKAKNFYALADSQIAMGPAMKVASLGDNLFLALYAEQEIDAARIGSLARQAMTKVKSYFGTTPFPSYTVHMEILKPISEEHQYGFSMEHMDSGTFYLRPQDVTDDRRTRYNFAHHFAHSWIPKRCYGTGYFPFRWELAPVLDSIWFAEGFGQYAAIAALAENEAERQRYIDARFRTLLRRSPDFLQRMPLVDLSYIGSTRYSEDFRVGRTLFARGGLLAAEIDDFVKAKTKDAKSLRDALRYLIAWTAKENRAWKIDELPIRIREATGVDTTAIFRKWLTPAQ